MQAQSLPAQDLVFAEEITLLILSWGKTAQRVSKPLHGSQKRGSSLEALQIATCSGDCGIPPSLG